MQNLGFEARCPRLPTYDDNRSPKAMLEDSVTTMCPAGTGLECSSYHIIVLAYSHGGIVTT